MMPYKIALFFSLTRCQCSFALDHSRWIPWQIVRISISQITTNIVPLEQDRLCSLNIIQIWLPSNTMGISFEAEAAYSVWEVAQTLIFIGFVLIKLYFFCLVSLCCCIYFVSSCYSFALTISDKPSAIHENFEHSYNLSNSMM